jgi:hypothetical protein
MEVVEEKVEEIEVDPKYVIVAHSNPSTYITLYLFDNNLTKQELTFIQFMSKKHTLHEYYYRYTTEYRRDRHRKDLNVDVLVPLIYVGIASGQYYNNYDIKNPDVKVRELLPNPIRLWESFATVIYLTDIGVFDLPKSEIPWKIYAIGHYVVDDYYN